MNTVKRCPRCRHELPIDQFYPNRAQSSGYNHYCKRCSKEASRKSRRKNPEGSRAIDRKWRRKLRAKVLTAYGGCCACCGETTPDFLTLDHINNDGAEHRRQIIGSRGGSVIYRWAHVNNYPPVLQLLCYNCNCSKAYYGSCPHRR